MRLQNSCRRGSSVAIGKNLKAEYMLSPQLAELKEQNFLGLKVVTVVLRHRKV